MPVKFNNVDSNPYDENISSAPLFEKLGEKNKQDLVSDMMSNIILEKQKMKNTSMIDMVGVLTPVLYYHLAPNHQNNYMTDANAINDMAIENKKFYEIKDLKVKFNSSIELQNDGEEDFKSYITTGSLIILPRTIKPFENDMFTILYHNKYLTYRITTVDVKSFEQDSGFECAFTLHKEDFQINRNNIISTYDYVQELVGTSYRPILNKTEFKQIKNCEKIYNHLSSVFNSLFYDKRINGYFLKDYNPKVSIEENNTNIIGEEGRIFRSSIDADHNVNSSDPIVVKKENISYDNYLNNFIMNNCIFRSYDGLLISTECLLPLDRIGYKRSIFGCLETQSSTNYKNTYLSPIEILSCQPGLSAYFVGKTNILHLEGKLQETKYELIPQKLISKISNTKSVTDKITDLVYGSMDILIVEIISRYIHKNYTGLIEAFEVLYSKMDELYEHSLSYANIYYLFPMLGYVIERVLKETFKDGIVFN